MPQEYEYRLAWKKTGETEVKHGTFLFDEPKDAKVVKQLLLVEDFLVEEIWLEDHNGNRKEIPS